MKIIVRLIVFILSIVTFVDICCSEDQISNNKHRCKYGDEKCLTEVVSYLFGKKFKGYQPFNVASLDPLKIQTMVLKQGKESPVNIDLVFKNSDVIGLKDCRVTKIKGFTKDYNELKEVHLITDLVSLLGDYTISGKVLILPITGSGFSNITLRDWELLLSFKGTPIVKNGKEYFQVKNMKLGINTSRMYMSLSNLFNGDKVLGETMNQFLNDNWKDIFGELQDVIAEGLGKVFEAVINNVFVKYPYNDYFISD